MFASATNGNALAERLLRPDAFSHEVTELQLLETHISWVVLTGPYAYKIKKPVRFGFVDYSTLSLRRKYCRNEIVLNRRFAPELYLDVVPIYESEGRLIVGNEPIEVWEKTNLTIPIDYAVRMRQFSQESIVAARLKKSELTSQSVDRFGKYVAEFHQSIQSNPPTNDCGRPDRIERDALDNFSTLFDAFQLDSRFEQIKRLEGWTRLQFANLKPKFNARLEARKIRCCHGDLHLKNVIQLDGQLMAFDGIEFNEAFQWIDVLSEIAFPVMDFVARGRMDLGWRLLNSYLESTDNYLDLDVLRFYLVYRALVRAKVTWLNPGNRTASVREKYSTNPDDLDEFAGPWDKYLTAASYFAFELKPRIAITHGFSGSGKSTIAIRLAEREGGIRIRSDVEREKLCENLSENFRSGDKYSPEMNDWVYMHLSELARSGIRAGFPMVIDATFLYRRRRALFAMLAQQLDVDFRILDCDAPVEELRQRIVNREKGPSEATIEVLEMQIAEHQPLTEDERKFVREELRS